MSTPANAGRTPAPPRLKLIEGRGNGRDSGGRPVAEPPAFKRLPPVPPEWLPDEAAAEWRRIVPELSRLDLVKPVDRAALTAYCLTWDRMVRAQKEMEDDGGSVVKRAPPDDQTGSGDRERQHDRTDKTR